MTAFSLFLSLCIIGLTQSCMPTRPPDPGIPVTRSPINPDSEATTQPGTVTNAPVTQEPVTDAPVTAAPEVPACQKCKESDLTLHIYDFGMMYSTGEVTVVNGCNQFNGLCDVGTATCTSPIVDPDNNLNLQDAGSTKAAMLYTCKDDGLWYGIDGDGDEYQVKAYFCYEQECTM